MKKRLLVPLCLGLGVSAAQAQEALRMSLAGEEAVAARRRALENQDANVKLGRASFLMGASVSFELNDNIDYSDLNRKQDVIFRPSISVIGTVPFSEDNAFYATVDAGYAKYLGHPEFDRV